jgi:hypothetical protein
MAAWLPALGTAFATVAILLTPGLLATATLRLPFTARLAIGGAFGVALIGLAGILAGLAGIPFALWQVFVLAALTAAALWAIRRRRADAFPPPATSVHWRWPVLTGAAAAVVVALIAFSAVPAPERISQTYDNVFHLSAIAHILDTGDASSLTLRTLIETERTWSFYPAAWHSTVALTTQLTGAPIAVAVNAAWLAVAVAIWLPGVAWLAQVILSRFDRNAVAVVALPLAAAFGAMPYGLLTWGTLYPTFLATALLPVAVAAPISARILRRDPVARQTSSPSWFAAVVTFTALAAVSVAQPRVLATWAVLIAPFAVAGGFDAYRRARRAGGRARALAGRGLAVAVAVALLAGGASFAYLVLRLGLFDRPLDDRLGGPQARATQSVAKGFGQVLSQSWPTGVSDGATFPAILLALAVSAGLLIAARSRGMRWIVVAYVGLAILFALAAGSDDVLTKLATALWYKDRYRLSSALPVLAVALGALGILGAAERLRAGRARTLIAAAAAWAVALTAAVGMVAGGLSADIAFVFRMPDRGAQSEVISQAQIEFMGGLDAIVPPDQLVLGDPWDGSALSAVYSDRRPVFPHVNGQWDPARATIAARLQDIATDPGVCEALNDLRVRYVLYHPHEFGGGDPAGNLFAGVHAAVEAGLFAEVSTDGDSRLYRIDQCGPLPQQ